MPGLVIEIQDEVLHEVLEYLKTEIVIAVIIQVFHGKTQSDKRLDTLFGNDNARMLFQKLEERRLQA